MSRLRGERGEAVTETVLLVPVLILLIMVVIQFGLWYHAQHVVQAAAQEGARAARSEGATGEEGADRASAFLARVGSRVVESPDVQAERLADSVTVRVEGHAPAVVPGLQLAVRASASSPTEEFSAP